MLTTPDRDSTREVFFRAWRRHSDGQPLEGVESLVVRVVLNHPEYQAMLADPDQYMDRDFSPLLGENNPFLHMGLHVAIEEQLTLNEPRGVRDIYKSLLTHNPDEHAVQHYMMECLGKWLHNAHHSSGGLDPMIYLDCLQRMSHKPRIK